MYTKCHYLVYVCLDWCVHAFRFNFSSLVNAIDNRPQTMAMVSRVLHSKGVISKELTYKIRSNHDISTLSKIAMLLDEIGKAMRDAPRARDVLDELYDAFKECDSAAGQQVVVKIRIMSLTDLSTAGKLQIFIVHAFGMMWLV